MSFRRTTLALTFSMGLLWLFLGLSPAAESDRKPYSHRDLPSETSRFSLSLPITPPALGQSQDLTGNPKVRHRAEAWLGGPTQEVNFLKAKDGNWSVAETPNFRILYVHDKIRVADVARIVERSRVAAYQKWFGAPEETWRPKASVYLDEVGKSKSLAGARGYTTQGRLGWSTSRYIRVRTHDDGMLDSVLPHEITHAIMVGRFGEGSLPPLWANEGMAVLAETKAEINQFLAILDKFYQKDQLFAVDVFMDMEEYPKEDVELFYAQSVSLVEFLTTIRDPQEFIDFLRDGVKDGYEGALKRHYGIKDYADLEKRWKAHAFGEGQMPTTGSERISDKIGWPSSLMTRG